MSIRDLIPFGRPGVPARSGDESPFHALQRDINRLFGDFWSAWGGLPAQALPRAGAEFSPQVNIEETEAALKVTAELPGMTDKDVALELHGNVLTLHGEKKEEREEKKKNYVRIERSYGAFTREIPLAAEVDARKATAEFKHGVLTVTLPKTPAAKTARRKITVTTS